MVAPCACRNCATLFTLSVSIHSYGNLAQGLCRILVYFNHRPIWWALCSHVHFTPPWGPREGGGCVGMLISALFGDPKKAGICFAHIDFSPLQRLEEDRASIARLISANYGGRKARFM